MNKKIYYIKGMHCASCEVVIEKKLLEIDGVEFADASLTNNQLTIGYNKKQPSVELLNSVFRESGYKFSDRPFESDSGLQKIIQPVVIALLVIGGFFLISKLGLASIINISSTSSLLAFFTFGLVAGLSSCAALVGGLVLSLSKQWVEAYGNADSFSDKLRPHFLFNIGRLISYGLLGILLGFLGEKFRISSSVTSIIIPVVSTIMILLALQMLGVKSLRRFRIALPRKLTDKVAKDETNRNRLTPFIIGFLTFLLPCGFTLVVEGVAILSASATQGFFILFFFALGTMIPLLAIGLFSAKLITNQKISANFLKVAGILILFFALYNLNVQFGLTSYLARGQSNSLPIVTSVPTVSVNPSGGDSSEVQLIKTVYKYGSDITPNTFEVNVGQPVRFEIDVQDNGSGCMSTIMIPGLWNSPELLRKGQVIVMEFTPQRTGSYRITCAMGVPRGTIVVK